MPEIGSSPTVARRRPIAAAVSPFITDPPLREARKVTPSMASMKNSGEPMERTKGRITGMASAKAKAPKMAPSRELIKAAPKARPASPFLAMGWPSTMVDAVIASPGIPKRIEVMSPVVAVTAAIPSRKAKASTASILKINGSIRARVTGPPRPGKIPTTKPIRIPSIIRVNVVPEKTWNRPPMNAWSISIIGMNPVERRAP